MTVHPGHRMKLGDLGVEPTPVSPPACIQLKGLEVSFSPSINSLRIVRVGGQVWELGNARPASRL